MTPPIDVDAVAAWWREAVETRSKHSGNLVYRADDHLSVRADSMRAILAERDALKREVAELRDYGVGASLGEEARQHRIVMLTYQRDRLLGLLREVVEDTGHRLTLHMTGRLTKAIREIGGEVEQ